MTVPTTGESHSDARARLGEAILADLDRFWQSVILDIVNTAQVPGLGKSIRAHEDQNKGFVRRFLELLFVDSRPPSRDEISAIFGPNINDRLRAGVPVAGYLRALHFALRAMWRYLTDTSERLEIEPDVLLPLVADLLEIWGLYQDIFSEISSAIAGEQLQADERLRSQLLQHLVVGTADAHDFEQLVAIGLRSDLSYVPLWARSISPRTIAELEHAIIGEQPASSATLFGIIDGDLVGIVNIRPILNDTTDVVVGVGPPQEPAAIAPAFALARRALDTAVAFGCTGVIGVEDLGARPAVLAERQLGRQLITRYLAPLAAHGRFGIEVEHTLGTWFAHGLRMDQTARALVIHPNTLRYRLRRYEAICNVNLTDADVLVELWWAIQRDAIDHGARTPDHETSRHGPETPDPAG